MAEYIIERENLAWINRKPGPSRVYVTGPHFTSNRDDALYGPGGGIFSSTTDPNADDLLVFDNEDDAERCALRRSWTNWRIVKRDEVPPLGPMKVVRP